MLWSSRSAVPPQFVGRDQVIFLQDIQVVAYRDGGDGIAALMAQVMNNIVYGRLSAPSQDFENRATCLLHGYAIISHDFHLF
jgi:hypothetical protein